MRVLALEPYYGGSHRNFLDGWVARSSHEWDVRTLPPRKWKWRMRHSALTFVESLAESGDDGWDVVFASDMLNFAEWKALAPRTVRELPAVVYFHENQLTYPTRFPKERDYQFGLTNITSALAADEVWFNSAFHRDEFLSAIPSFLRKMPDHQPATLVERIRDRSRVRSPGVEPPPAARQPCEPRPLHVLWAARWEFDKAPEVLFEAVERLMADGIALRLSVLGQRFEEVPPLFVEARQRLAPIVEQWGFVTDRDDYRRRLADADVFVSTAIHEFFGLAAIEAIAAGARPLLPRRLAYPEVLELDRHPERERFFYDGSADALASELARLAALDRARLGRSRAELVEAVGRFDWPTVAPALDRALENVARRSRSAV